MDVGKIAAYGIAIIILLGIGFCLGRCGKNVDIEQIAGIKDQVIQLDRYNQQLKIQLDRANQNLYRLEDSQQRIAGINQQLEDANKKLNDIIERLSTTNQDALTIVGEIESILNKQ